MRYLLSLFILVSFQLRAADSLQLPALTSPVMDLGDFLTEAEEQDLSKLAYEINANNGPQITILTVPDLQGQEIEDYSIRVAEKWQLGTKEKDNGLLIVLSKAERRVRIEVGNGIEGEITDYDTARYTRDIFPRYFKAGQFHAGFRDFMDHVAKVFNIQASEGMTYVRRAPTRTTIPGGNFFIMGILAVLAFGTILFRKPVPRGAFIGTGLTGISFLLGLPIGMLILIFIMGLIVGMIGVGNFLTAVLMSGRGGRGGGGFGGGGGWSGGGGGFSGGGSSGSW